MNGLRRAALIALAATSFIVMCGARSACDRRIPTIQCDDVSISVTPGTCTVLPAPCGNNQWLDLPRVDGITLCGAPGGIGISTDRSSAHTVRTVCAPANAALYVNEPIDYVYGRGNEIGVGIIYLTTAPPLSVSASASPAELEYGNATQLSAAVSGGIPPYTYTWSPLTGFGLSSQPNSPNPIAAPPSTTTYTVQVSDAAGQQLSASVTVTVVVPPPPPGTVTVIADPDHINAGFSTQLNATIEGGVGPFTYAWSPSDTLNAANVANPTAFPIHTTTYTVDVTDGAGNVSSASVRVIVNLEVVIDANPQAITAGDSAQLDALVEGGLPPYTFLWAPAISLSSTTIQNPVATPATTTTYNVIVSDSLGASASAQLTMQVLPANGGPLLEANFTFVYDGAENLDLDASSSIGNIVQYEWDFSWEPLQVDVVTTSAFTNFYAFPGLVGTITLTVVDANGNRASRTLPFP